MKAKLYDCFKHWMQYDSIWFYSDPHFGDTQAQAFKKQCCGYDVTDEEQVKRINAKVGKKDLLIILGDVGDVSYISKLKAGYKVLIKGNHDVGDTKYQRITKDHEDNQLFDEVYPGKLQIRKDIILSHEQVSDEYCLNIHGHRHPSVEQEKKTDFQKWLEIKKPTEKISQYADELLGLQFLYVKETGDLHFNCCAEIINFTPVNIKPFLESGILNNVTDIHRKVIDKHINAQNQIRCNICGRLFEPSDRLQDTCDKCALEIGEVFFKI